MKLELTKVYRNDKDKNGNPILNKFTGKPQSKLSIKCKLYGDRWISGFSAYWNENWKEGMTVEADVVEKGEFLNLVKPDPLAQVIKRLEMLEAVVFKK